MGTKSNILTVNAGSSSIKLDLFSINNSGGLERVLNAAITRIGQAGALLSVSRQDDEKQTHQLDGVDYGSAIDHLVQWLVAEVPLEEIAAIGHRVVHGGPAHSQPELLTDDLERELSSLIAFDPGHAPAALQLINVLRQQFPDVPQMACFDTAFFHDMPRVAQQLPLPRKYEAQGLRRYGFHGLSYNYLLAAFGEMAGETAANGRVIFAHLGSGASLAATFGGQPVDTTMGFTSASGIMMSSRTGDLDPGIIGFLNQQGGLSIEDYGHMVNFESGLVGVSETSADMYTLLQAETTDERAAEAVNLFVYQVKKSIGALAASLGGLDSLIFSGGIGEQSPLIRQRVVEGLGFLGIELDDTANQQQAELISAPHSTAGVHVIATDEAQVIARQAKEILYGSN
ncbi:acetate/propionate family kinase [Candidatus Saccharibacteria bacterium CG_4_10_14_0_2_um_filter_52_9]|nr:MAG: acetate/propionate family kinase [Candidatus Saccharibacteria bacterium CG_4_10_14_0_2_um_filter_52_9]